MKEEELEELCGVCGEPLDEKNVSCCSLCGRKFHMAWSIDAEVRNCGRVYSDDVRCAIGFACNICLSEHPELGQSSIDMGQGFAPW